MRESKAKVLIKKTISSILLVSMILTQFVGDFNIAKAASITVSTEEQKIENLYIALKPVNDNGWGYGYYNDYKRIWSIVSYDENDTYLGSTNNLYCAQADYGNTWQENGTDAIAIYNLSYNFNKNIGTTPSNIINGIVSGEHFNKILWLIDNMYIPGESNKAEFLEQADIYYSEDEGGYIYISKNGHDYYELVSSNVHGDYTLTDDDIVAIQQAALWYFTNNTDSNYNQKGIKSWLKYTNDGSDYYFFTSLSEKAEGEARNEFATVLFNYLVDEAEAVAIELKENGEKYELQKSTAKLWLSTSDGTTRGIDNEEQPLLEIHKIKEFDLSLRKAIASVQYKKDGQMVNRDLTNVYGSSAERSLNEDGSIKNINVTTLNTETTATYNHRKDPIVVEEGDIVEYAITIYNEQSAAGYAKTIVDQLPPATEIALVSTEDVTSSTGNIYGVSISTTDNKVTFSLKSENPVAIPGFDGATLSSETIKLKCVVVSKPELENAKILTNIAYISEAFNTETQELIATSEVGADRDSAPGSYPTYQGTENDDKQNGVTYWNQTSPDFGYTGDIENPADLSNATTYYKGIQDDDDFEKIIISPKIEITATKVWNDQENQDGKRAEYELTLTGKVGETVVYTNTQTLAADQTTYTWTGIPKYSNGQEIVYTVDETKVPDEYEKEVNGFTITNSYTPGKIQITINKIWKDKNNQDGKRAEYEVTLTGKVGETVVYTDTQTLTASQTTYSWNGLDKYKNGQEIVYTVDETKVPEGYVKKVEGYTITNSYISEETEITVYKKWDDSNNQYKTRPESIKVQLYANGEIQGNPVEIKSTENWKYTWTGLDKNQNGQEIQYTVKEINEENQVVEDGQKYNENYLTTYEKDLNNFTITNTLVTFDLKLVKCISAINNTEINNRLQTVDLSKLNTYDENLKQWISTGKYTLAKEPIKVKPNDYVTYTFRIYNEGNYDGYATEISEDIPEGLEFLVITDGAILSWDGTEQKDITEEIKVSEMYNKIIETNLNWGYSQGSTIITTRGLSEDIIQGYGQEGAEYADTENKIDYKEISAIFRVKEDVPADTIIRNEAAISEDKAVDEEGKEIVVKDRDSTPGNTGLEWEKEDSQENYDEEGKWPIYVEDDEDYDNIIIKVFDLSLRKRVAQIKDVDTQKIRMYSRSATLDTDNSQINTLYDYYNKYASIPGVKAGDIVTYSIVVYNEGEIDGYASLVVDSLPSGLEFVQYEPGDESTNDQYGWTLVEGTENVYQTDYLSYEKDVNKGTEQSTILKAYDGEGEAQYKEIYIECKVKENITKEDSLLNVAQIAEDSDENGNLINDEDSIPGNTDNEEKWKKEDDLDIEILQLQEFDLSLKKFITQVEAPNGIKQITTRIPKVSYDKEKGQLAYTQPKETLIVHVGDIIIYTIRVFNEGDIDGYAKSIKDDIPQYLEYLPNHKINIENQWVMYDAQDNITENAEEVVSVKTEYLSKENSQENLLKAFDKNINISEENPYYKDVKIAFKVLDPNSTEVEIVNFAQISEDTDAEGDQIRDIDSETDNGKLEPKEDEEDNERVKVEYFDLSLLKYVTKVLVNENGEERIIETGNVGDENDIIPHVQINKKNINKTTVKFVYTIQITNEGQIAGEATEITDYIPEGLVFVAEDNELWTDEGNNIISTKQLKGTTLQPGETAQVEVVLRWINGENNLGPKINVAEISEDYNEENVSDRDSTPDNKKEAEDDIDDATVLLSVNQGGGIQGIYINLILIALVIILVGAILIKKFLI